MRSRARGVAPIPGAVGTRIVPLGVTSTSGSMMSSDPIAAARRNVAGKSEIRQCRHGDVVCATDAGFQHTATPDRDGFGLAEIVDSARGGVTANAAESHIDDFAGGDFNGGAGVFDIVDAFVETDRRFELALQGGVGVDIVIAERLLDHDEEKLIEMLERSSASSEAVSPGIGVHHQTKARESLTQRAGQGSTSLPGLIFIFDALVAISSEFLFNFRDQAALRSRVECQWETPEEISHRVHRPATSRAADSFV